MFSKTQLKKGFERQCKECINKEINGTPEVSVTNNNNSKNESDEGERKIKKKVSEVLCMDKVVGPGATAILGSKVAVRLYFLPIYVIQ
jgi:hypothetical protein